MKSFDFDTMPPSPNARLRACAAALQEEFGEDEECRIFVRDLIGEFPKSHAKAESADTIQLIRIMMRYIYLAGRAGIAVEKAGYTGKGLLARTQEEYESLFGNRRKTDWLKRRAARQKQAILEEARKNAMKHLEKAQEGVPEVFVESLTNQNAAEGI